MNEKDIKEITDILKAHLDNGENDMLDGITAIENVARSIGFYFERSHKGFDFGEYLKTLELN